MKLINERIYLRPVELADAPLFLKHTEDEEIRHMTGTKARFSIEQIERHIEQTQQDDTRYDFAICLNVTDQLVGELSVLDIDPDNQSAGFRINERGLRAYEKKGFKREGVLREALYLNGTFSDEIIMAVIRRDYLKARS
ncbi:GNAT family N-acetyltransferase [Planococcus maritimus]|uniref:GNAT family N-acetyltransferase n=1 Tax=Planococcus maritimus TaxID=192421 RepID=UPI0031393C60